DIFVAGWAADCAVAVGLSTAGEPDRGEYPGNSEQHVLAGQPFCGEYGRDCRVSPIPWAGAAFTADIGDREPIRWGPLDTATSADLQAAGAGSHQRCPAGCADLDADARGDVKYGAGNG